MADPSHLDMLKGKETWNAWRSTNPYMPVDFSGADLRSRDLTGYELRCANFSGANLREVRLGPGTLAWNANFTYADMYRANLDGAELPDADFANADLYEASLRNANLRSAKLAECRGAIRQEQLAGSDITNATLPPQLTTLLEKLDNVKSISESARKLFLAVLAACLYCWLTIATTTDLNLITNRISSPLPIIQTAIPIVGFYVVAPLLLLCTYLYFHFYLQKLWEELGSLPAYLQDGRPLHAKVDPWLLNDLVRAHLPLLNSDRPFLSYLQLWISVLLAWWFVPLTLFLFWGRYIRKHEWYGTGLHIVLLTISFLAGVCLYRLAIATLHHGERRSFNWKLMFKGVLLSPRTAMTLAGLILLAMISYGAIQGTPSEPFYVGHQITGSTSAALGPRTWVPRLTALFGYSVFADLRNAELSTKKTIWTERNPDDPLSVSGIDLQGANLRFANLSGAFLPFSNLTHADLTGVNLEAADLAGSRLDKANISEAYLVSANLPHATMKGVNLMGANLVQADLTGSDLSDAILTKALLYDTKLSSADLGSANLTSSDLQYADFSHASLVGARLNGAGLQGADLTDAHFSSSNLKSALLDKADLAGADFRDAYDLTAAQIMLGESYEDALFDEKIIQELGLPLDHNQRLELERQKKTVVPPPSLAP